jgi:glycosyltransferase involved in cell wall biosynthesis
VRDGVNGLVVPPGDVPALRAAILALLGDEQRRRQMGRAGMALMEAEFSTDVMVDRHIALYREVLGGND